MIKPKKTKKCKHCKEVFTPFKTTQKYCTKTKCLTVFVNEEKQKAWKKRKADLIEDSKTLSSYLKEAQKAFNTFIRLRDRGEPCISCGKIFSSGEIVHASHLKNAGHHYNVRYDEDNVWVSCVKCNTFLGGNEDNYKIRLIKKIGQERVDRLDRICNITRHFTKEELKEIEKKYKIKCKELKY
jgi:hypothetical protein